MRLAKIVVGAFLTMMFLSIGIGTAAAQQPVVSNVAKGGTVVPGYSGGCNIGFPIFVQNQFEPYGTKIRRSLNQDDVSVGLPVNIPLISTGWVKYGDPVYPINPPGIKGEYWFYVPYLPTGGSGWVSDAGVRSVPTANSPTNADADLKQYQIAPRPDRCALTPR